MERGCVCPYLPLSQTHRYGQSLPQVHAESAQQIAIPSFRVMGRRERGARETSRKAGASPDHLVSPPHCEKHLLRWKAGPVGSLVTAVLPSRTFRPALPAPACPQSGNTQGRTGHCGEGGHTGCPARPCQPTSHTRGSLLAPARSSSCRPAPQGQAGWVSSWAHFMSCSCSQAPCWPRQLSLTSQSGKPGPHQASIRLSARLTRSSADRHGTLLSHPLPISPSPGCFPPPSAASGELGCWVRSLLPAGPRTQATGGWVGLVRGGEGQRRVSGGALSAVHFDRVLRAKSDTHDLPPASVSSSVEQR